MKKQTFLITLAGIVLSINLHPAALAGDCSKASAPQLKGRPVKLVDTRQLKAAFEKDQGKVRLVALVSPT
jgi:hypothetical protein